MKKTIHMAGMISADGDASALCYESLRPIDLAKASWSLRAGAVTCKECQTRLREREQVRKDVKHD